MAEPQSNGPSEPAGRRLGRRVLWGLVFGVVVYAGFAAFSDFEALAGQLRRFPVEIFAAALGLSVVNYSFRWAKWHYYLRCVDVEVGIVDSIVVFVAGMTMSITPGKVGEVLKSALLHRSHGISVARTAPIVVAERLTDLFGLFVIAAFGIGMFDYGRVAFFGVLGVLAVGMFVLQSPAMVGRLLDLLEHLPLVGKLRPRLDEAYGSMQRLVAWRPLIVTTLLSAVSWSMEALAFYWIVGALDPIEYGLNLSAFVFSMTTILGAVSFLPGGLGVTEGSMIGALLLFGVFTSESTATVATYLIRFATLWFAVGLGIIGLTVFERTHD